MLISCTVIASLSSSPVGGCVKDTMWTLDIHTHCDVWMYSRVVSGSEFVTSTCIIAPSVSPSFYFCNCHFSCLRRGPDYRYPHPIKEIKKIKTDTTAEVVLNCRVCTLGWGCVCVEGLVTNLLAVQV